MRGSELRTETLTKELKEKLVEYLLERHNVVWLNDDIEREIYRLLFDLLDKYIICSYWGIDDDDDVVDG